MGRWHRLWFKHLLLRLLESVGCSGQRDKVQPVAMMGAAPDEARSPIDSSAIRRTSPPLDWSDIEGWNRCLKAESSEGPLGVPTAIGARGWQSVRFLKFARHLGGRVWFPGCGTDLGPRFYAYVGCAVMATDFSPVAVHAQQHFAGLAAQSMFVDWSSFVKGSPRIPAVSTLRNTISWPAPHPVSSTS